MHRQWISAHSWDLRTPAAAAYRSWVRCLSVAVCVRYSMLLSRCVADLCTASHALVNHIAKHVSPGYFVIITSQPLLLVYSMQTRLQAVSRWTAVTALMGTYPPTCRNLQLHFTAIMYHPVGRQVHTSPKVDSPIASSVFRFSEKGLPKLRSMLSMLVKPLRLHSRPTVQYRMLSGRYYCPLHPISAFHRANSIILCEAGLAWLPAQTKHRCNCKVMHMLAHAGALIMVQLSQ